MCDRGPSEGGSTADIYLAPTASDHKLCTRTPNSTLIARPVRYEHISGGCGYAVKESVVAKDTGTAVIYTHNGPKRYG